MRRLPLRPPDRTPVPRVRALGTTPPPEWRRTGVAARASSLLEATRPFLRVAATAFSPRERDWGVSALKPRRPVLFWTVIGFAMALAAFAWILERSLPAPEPSESASPRVAGS